MSAACHATARPTARARLRARRDDRAHLRRRRQRRRPVHRYRRLPRGACVLRTSSSDCTKQLAKVARQAGEQAAEHPAEVQEGRRARQAPADAPTASPRRRRSSTRARPRRATTIHDSCPATATASTRFGGACDQLTRPDCGGGLRDLRGRPRRPTTSSSSSTAAAPAAAPRWSKQITNTADCVGGR